MSKRSSTGIARVRPDPAWIRARQNLLKQVKAEVRLRLGPETPDVATFRRRYESDLRKPWRPSTKARLLAEIERADIVYGGDFHALHQSQRTHLRILRAIATERPVILALECFAKNSQKWLDLYLDGAIDLDELKRRSRWGRAWGFPWEHYKPLLEIAKRRGFRLLALNDSVNSRHHANLEHREKLAARILRDAYFLSPGSLIYVVFGDLHLAERHLPRLVRNEVNSRIQVRDLIIHMNAEKIYFDLARRGLELAVDVVEFKTGGFCVLSSPPWLQWQSYLLFLERANDPDLARDDEDDDFDPTDQVAGLIRLAALEFGLEVDAQDFAVYSADQAQIWRSLDQRLRPVERSVARALLAGGRSFVLPQVGLGYLARDSINHAAALAGQYIHAKLSKRRRTLWKMPGDFKALIWTEAVGYFFSKVINHKRTSETLADLRSELALSSTNDQGREAMRLAVDQLMSELVYIRQGRRRPLKTRVRQRASYFEAARILGGIMGERLYMAHRSRRLKAQEIVQLLRLDVARPGFQSDYEDIIRTLGEDKGEQGMSRQERL